MLLGLVPRDRNGFLKADSFGFETDLNQHPYHEDVTADARNFSEELYKVLARLQVMRAPVALINGLVNRERFTLNRDVHYGLQERQRLDVYVPRGAYLAPVVIFIHGGYWHGGDKSEYGFLAESLVQFGFVVVNINYRLAPSTVFPGFVQDAAKAVRWVHANIRRYGGDPDRIGIVGHSSGAHIGSLLSTDPEHLQGVGLSRDHLKAFVGLSGPYDFLSVFETDEKVRVAMGARETWHRTQPVNLADARTPPMMLMHGLRDAIVHPLNAQHLHDRVLEQGGVAELRLYAGMDHFLILGVLSKLARFLEPAVLDDMVHFLQRHV